jgi:hypothetical protein
MNKTYDDRGQKIWTMGTYLRKVKRRKTPCNNLIIGLSLACNPGFAVKKIEQRAYETGQLLLENTYSHH